MVELFQENSQSQNFVMNLTLDGSPSSGSISTNGVIETPSGDVDAEGFAPMIEKFRSAVYPDAYRSDKDLVFIGPSVTKTKLIELGIDPNEAYLTYSDIEVWWNIDVEDAIAVGYYKINSTTDWLSGEKVIQYLDRDNVAGRTNMFISLTVQKPQNDDIFVLAYSDSPSIVGLSEGGLSNITATISTNAFVPIYNQSIISVPTSNTAVDVDVV